MNLGKHAVVMMIACGSAVGSFVATQALQPTTSDEAEDRLVTCATKPCGTAGCCKSLAGWLGLPREKVESLTVICAPFGAERANLEAGLFSERQKLADLFESADATDDDILAQVERVIEADSALERRVAVQLLALRPHLKIEQCRRLYKRCADGIREAGGCRWRHQPNTGTGQGGNCNPPSGCGPDREKSESTGP